MADETEGLSQYTDDQKEVVPPFPPQESFHI